MLAGGLNPLHTRYRSLDDCDVEFGHCPVIDPTFQVQIYDILPSGVTFRLPQRVLSRRILVLLTE